MTAKRFILIGNYPPDGQESMRRFAELLAEGLTARNIAVEVIAPRRILVPRGANTTNGLWKWIAYLDKWVVFPFSLRKTVNKQRRQFGDQVRYHICDHSNAPYLAHLPAKQTGITCHDVLAIRSALGYPAAYCEVSRTGILLQRWIWRHLRQAPRIGCVSHLTLQHLCEVAGKQEPQAGWTAVHNAFNANFARIDETTANAILAKQGIALPRPFLLHVGSNLPRKNRRMLLSMIGSGNQPWPGHVCFAGAALNAQLVAEAKKLGVLDRIHSVTRPDHTTLCALYGLAQAFVFPSFSEGFGWPLIEAQACGAPVIASNYEPLPEVSGGAALHADPHNVDAFVAALRQLNDFALRNSLIEAGLKNASRFDVNAMISKYLALHEN
jgi:glycosyltransferase involved in cell wall biosynthesis